MTSPGRIPAAGTTTVAGEGDWPLVLGMAAEMMARRIVVGGEVEGGALERGRAGNRQAGGSAKGHATSAGDSASNRGEKGPAEMKTDSRVEIGSPLLLLLPVQGRVTQLIGATGGIVPRRPKSMMVAVAGRSQSSRVPLLVQKVKHWVQGPHLEGLEHEERWCV